jgi:hypothetical protein
MHVSDSMPRSGEELLPGWVVDRQAIVDEEKTDYGLEVWVTPRSA